MGPLQGIRVLDLTAVLMGPYCTQILADHGADVIKIEGPDGDTTRQLPPGHMPGMGGMFHNLNRGKRGLGLDLKRPEGRAVLLKLAESADVFVHALRADAMQRLGLTYDAFRAVNPRIIYANAYGFSRRGPYSGQAAYDDIIQAISGIASTQGRLTGTPGYVANVLADKVSGLTVLYAILMALLHRERGGPGGGEGQEIEVGMFETMASFVLAEHINGAVFDPPLSEPIYPRVVSPDRRPYRTADGYISLLLYNDKQFRAFAELAGSPAWTQDPRFATLSGRAKAIDEVYAHVGATLESRTSAEWLEGCQRLGIPAARINETRDLFDDPHLKAIDFFAVKQTKDGPMRFPGIPTWFSATPPEIREAGPALGEHTREVLAEAGYAGTEIEALFASGAVFSSPAPAAE
jgi:crotonobetainyl-CoA:carnitine CoA-transferase CaiB-like acyl-CoA transferase